MTTTVTEVAVETPKTYLNVVDDVFSMPKFDPAIHLAFTPPTARHSFTELGLSKPDNVPDICFTEPFQLFSEEGVRMLRRELFRKEFLDKYMRSWERAPCYIGGHTNDPGVRNLLTLFEMQF